MSLLLEFALFIISGEAVLIAIAAMTAITSFAVGAALDRLHKELRKEAADMEYMQNRDEYMYWKYMVKEDR